MNLFLKLFLSFFIAEIIAILIISRLISYSEVCIFGLLLGFVLSIIMALFLSSVQISSTNRLSPEDFEDVYKVRHNRTIELNVSYDEAFDLCLESIGLIKRPKIKKNDRSEGIINATAGINWRTWGEKISFKIIEIDTNHTQVEFSSKPIVPITLIDWGKNLENILIINNHLKEHSIN